MKYVGIHTQQSRNNARSVVLLILFPCLVIALTYVFCYAFVWLAYKDALPEGESIVTIVNTFFVGAAPYVAGGVFIWFLIAWFSHTSIIRHATGAKPLARKENMRVYNLVENLCMSRGMRMPQINVIDDNSLNAYASGINDKTYTVALSRGIIDKLNDEELEGVIAHELTHIRNRDVRLLIVSIVFVGIFSMVAGMALRALRYQSFARSKDNKGNGAVVILLLLAVVAGIGYLFSMLMRFAISRNREYMADAGAAELTKNPQALASALRKISADPMIEAVKQDDVAQLFIEHPQGKTRNAFNSLFATHPPIQKRIAVLENF